MSAMSYKTIRPLQKADVKLNEAIIQICGMSKTLCHFPRNWNHMSTLIFWFSDMEYFHQWCIISSLLKSQNYMKYLNLYLGFNMNNSQFHYFIFHSYQIGKQCILDHIKLYLILWKLFYKFHVDTIYFWMVK